MDRVNSFTIEVTDWGNSDLWHLLSELQDESCLFDQPEFKSDGIFWFSNLPKELFQFANCFNWLSGSARLWHNEQPVTRFNYRVKVWDIEPSEESEGQFHYTYIDWNEITNVAPIKEDILWQDNQ